MKRIIKRVIVLLLISVIMVLPNKEFAVSEFILGDINGDSIVDTKDLKLISKHISESKNKKQIEWILTGEKLESADINRNGEVNAGDVIAMIRYLATKSNPYNIGTKYQTEEYKTSKKLGEKAKDKKTTEQGEEEQQKTKQQNTDPIDIRIIVNTNTINPNEIKSEIEEQKLGAGQVAVNIMKENLASSNIIRFEKEQIEIKTNEVEKLKVITTNTEEPIKLTTSDSNIVELYGVGIAVGKNKGEAIITAEQGCEKTQCKIKVVDRNEATKIIEIDKTEVKLGTGESTKLEATTEPANKEVKWVISNSEVAEIRQDGTVLAKNAGTTTVTAISGDKIATSVVTVEEKEMEIEEVAFNKQEVEITQGEETSIIVGVAPKNATKREVEIVQENDNIKVENRKVEVNKEGIAEVKIKANRAGTTEIIARAGEKEARSTVKVKETEVEKVTLDASEIKMEENQLRRITATIEPEIATEKKIEWTSSNKEVAEVSEEGLVTSKKSGEATISATAGGKSATCKVIVEAKKVSVSGIKLSSNRISVKEDQEVKVTVDLVPSNATNKEINVKLDNDNASIESENVVANESGKAEIKITGKKIGTSTITVSSGAIVEKCNITIIPKEILVEKITLSSSNITINKGNTAKLTIKIEPTNATNKEITIKANNSNASVNKTTVTAGQDGTAEITIKGEKAGTSTITATSGKKSASTKVTVNAVAESITLNENNITLQVGKTKQLKATVTPSNAVDKKVTWSSSNKNVATVDSKGKVTAKGAGNATITAKTTNGKKTNCKVKVEAGYWEITNGKYIYHYSNGTKKQFSKSCYVSMKKIKDVKAINPKINNESKFTNWKTSYTYAGIRHEDYCCEDQTANKLAQKNGTSPYAIVVDLNVANVHIYKMGENGWEPYRTYIAFVGNPKLSKDTYNYNLKKNTKQYSKGNTPIGLFYIDGSRWYDAGDEMKYWVEFGVQGHNYNNGLYLHFSPYAPKNQSVDGVTGEAKGYRINTSCITFGNIEIGKWIYYNIGRGTPVLIW